MELTTIESLNEDQLRELIMQAFAQLALKEQVPMSELVKELLSELMIYGESSGENAAMN